MNQLTVKLIEKAEELYLRMEEKKQRMNELTLRFETLSFEEIKELQSLARSISKDSGSVFTR